MKGVKALLIVLIITGVTFACVTFGEETIHVGYYDDYPLIFNDAAGNPNGFFIDLLKDFSKQSDYNISFQYAYWSENLEKLEGGSIDILVDIVYSHERNDIYDFSTEPVILNWGKVAVASHLNVQSIIDLEGLTIGYLANDYYFISEEGLKQQVTDFKLDVSFVAYDHYGQILEAIHQGTVDAGVLNRFAIHEIYDYSTIKAAPINFAASNLLLASTKGKNANFLKAFDDHLKTLKDDRASYYYERYNFWVNQVKRSPFEIFFEKNKGYIILTVLAIFMTMAFSRYMTTKKVKEIKKTNKRLGKINVSIQEDNASIEQLEKEMDQAYVDSEKTINKFQKIISFLASAMAIQEAEEKTKFLTILFHQVCELIDALDDAWLFFYDEAKAPYVFDLKNRQKEKVQGMVLDQVFKAKGQVKVRKKYTIPINEAMTPNSKVLLAKINEAIAPNPWTALITLRANDTIVAELLLSRKTDQVFSPGEQRIMYAIANIGESYYLNESFRKVSLKFQQEIVFSLVEMLEIHDEYTKGHSEVVANLSRRFAEYLGLEASLVEDIYWAGLLHDIGKILVDKSILQKKDKLTLAEEEIIKKHSIFGYQALNQSKVTSRMAEYVLYHHERYDGEGYPQGLKGEEIPLGSRIIALADSYEAIGSNRSCEPHHPKKYLDGASFSRLRIRCNCILLA